MSNNDTKTTSNTNQENQRISRPKFADPPRYSQESYEYVLSKGNREHSLMTELRQLTSSHERARMMTTPEQVCFIQFLLKAISAKSTIEVGVFTGYSTLGTALALPSDGKVIACDISDEYASIGRPIWEKAGVLGKIDLRIGSAIDTLNGLINHGQEGKFDFMYVDADKVNYVNYFNLGLKLLRTGGVIAFDNVLWGGNIVKLDVVDEDTVALRKLNELLHADERVDISMLPIGDGVTFVRKK